LVEIVSTILPRVQGTKLLAGTPHHVFQPIGPAHYLVFLAIDATITTIILRRVDFGLVVVSAFAEHLGVDNGLIPPFSPVSFQYLQLDPYHLPLLAMSAVSAFGADHFVRRREKPV